MLGGHPLTFSLYSGETDTNTIMESKEVVLHHQTASFMRFLYGIYKMTKEEVLLNMSRVVVAIPTYMSQPDITAFVESFSTRLERSSTMEIPVQMRTELISVYSQALVLLPSESFYLLPTLLRAFQGMCCTTLLETELLGSLT